VFRPENEGEGWLPLLYSDLAREFRPVVVDDVISNPYGMSDKTMSDKTMNTLSTPVAGKFLEELTTTELEELAIEAGRQAREKAKQRGACVTEWRDGQLLWVYPQGQTAPVS
jgi:hypothetical protein